MGRDQYTMDALKKRFKYLSEMAAEVREDRQARAAEAAQAADCSALMSGARNDSDDEDLVRIREAIARDPLTPPPSEPSPTIQSKRYGGQNATETITSTTHSPNSGHHARDDNTPRQMRAVSNSDNPRTSAGDSWRPQGHCSPGWSRNPPCGPHGEPRGRSPLFRPQTQRRSQNQYRWRDDERNNRWSFPGRDNRSNQKQQFTRVEVNHGPVHRVHHYFNN